MPSDAEQWEQLQALFHLAEGAPAGERQRLLESADPALRVRALALLEAADTAPASPPPAAIQTIGPYTVIRHLGSGGMGAVYLVEYATAGVTQRAALKMLAPHAAGPAFAERFRREQHILASLDHPDITGLLDAGIDAAGRPYLVMDYVDGQPLDVYCDQRKLSIEARVRLVYRICEAVDYAHRKLIVHLDLKPSNILVTAEGAPKLLDFGTSKLLQADGSFTSTLPVTPSYASPEQLRNEPVTTACDIYSLGVILFELLTGKKPGGEGSLAAMMERAVQETEPPRLDQSVTAEAAANRGLAENRLRQLLGGDLANIVRNCLNPRPQRRYKSAAALADDLDRYLRARPVLARPQTTLYVVSRFVGRNRGKVLASVAMGIALAGSLGYAWWGQQQALREGQRAMRMQTFIYRLFKMANTNYTGKPAASLKEFLQLGIKVLPSYIKDPRDLRQAQLALAESMLWNFDYDNAEQVYSDVVRTARGAGDTAAEAEALTWSGTIAFQQSKYDLSMSRTARALELSRGPGIPPRTRVLSDISYAAYRETLGRITDENLHLLEDAVQQSRDRGLPPHEVGQALYYLAAAHALRGRLDEAEREHQEGLRIERQDPVSLCDQTYHLFGLATVRRNLMKNEESVPFFQQAHDAFATCYGADFLLTLQAGVKWSDSLLAVGQSQKALSMLEAALPTWRKSALASPASLFDEIYDLGVAYRAVGRPADAEKMASEAAALVRGKIAPNDARAGLVEYVWAGSLTDQQRYAEALPHAQEAARITALKTTTPRSRSDAAAARSLLTNIQSRVP
jgi:serine/threonine protein kinase